MGDVWITDIRHYLDGNGDLAAMPGPAMNLALHLGSFVAGVPSRPARGVERTNVPCRRSPGRKRCPGEVVATCDLVAGEVEWRCERCGDNGVISGWEGTRWDRREEP